MINSLKFVDFQDLVECHSLNFYSKESFLKLNFEFLAGNIYGLISDFGCGSWGLSTCIGGRVSKQYTGKILLNGIEISPEELIKYSCFISENIFLNIGNSSSTPKQCIEKALLIGSLPYSANQIKSMFCLTDERFERPLPFVSGEIWNISMAVNFAQGKQIFCFPWLNAIDINRFITANRQGILDLLVSAGKIIIVPTSQCNIVRKHCNHVLVVKNGVWKHKRGQR